MRLLQISCRNASGSRACRFARAEWRLAGAAKALALVRCGSTVAFAPSELSRYLGAASVRVSGLCGG